MEAAGGGARATQSFAVGAGAVAGGADAIVGAGDGAVDGAGAVACAAVDGDAAGAADGVADDGAAAAAVGDGVGTSGVGGVSLACGEIRSWKKDLTDEIAVSTRWTAVALWEDPEAHSLRTTTPRTA
jgi:hypothetical protein